ncbi:MAG: hypothetical protein JJU36_15335 [Phycisphaeraceae bacterium]|nr:hypothetical protein [Phycisphaeraceae bacterium]
MSSFESVQNQFTLASVTDRLASSLSDISGRARFWTLLGWMLQGLFAVVAGAVVVIGLDAFWPMGEWLRFAVLCGGLIGWFGWLVYRRPRRWRRSMDRAASEAERWSGQTNNPLVNAWQLGQVKADEPDGPAHAQIRRAVELGAQIIGQPRVRSAPPPPQVGRWAGLCCGLLVVILALELLMPPLISGGLMRLAAPWSNTPPFSFTRFEVEVKPQRIEIGQNATINVTFRGSMPTEAHWIELDDRRRPIGEHSLEPMSPNAHTGRWTGRIIRPQSDVAFHILTDTGRSKRYTLKVDPPPPAELSLSWLEDQADPVVLRPNARTSLVVEISNRGGPYPDPVELPAAIEVDGQWIVQGGRSGPVRLNIPDGRSVPQWPQSLSIQAPDMPGEYRLIVWLGQPYGPDVPSADSAPSGAIGLTIRVPAPDEQPEATPDDPDALVERARDAELMSRMLQRELERLLQELMRLASQLDETGELDPAMLERLQDLLARLERIELLRESLCDACEAGQAGGDGEALMALVNAMMRMLEEASNPSLDSSQAMGMLTELLSGSDGDGTGGIQTGELGQLIEGMSRATRQDAEGIQQATGDLSRALEAYDSQDAATEASDDAENGTRAENGRPDPTSEADQTPTGRAEGSFRDAVESAREQLGPVEAYYRRLPEQYRQRVDDYLRSMMELDRQRD